MTKLRMALVVAIAGALMAGVVGGQAGTASGEASASAAAEAAGKKGKRGKRARKATVRLGDNFFKPRKGKVRRRTLVRFKWIGNKPHNVVKLRGPGKGFASKTTARKGINFKKRFRKRGRYKLICTIHPGMQMKLKVR